MLHLNLHYAQFVVDRSGTPVQRFGSRISPSRVEQEVITDILYSQELRSNSLFPSIHSYLWICFQSQPNNKSLLMYILQ